jgi:hypothetical protein
MLALKVNESISNLVKTVYFFFKLLILKLSKLSVVEQGRFGYGRLGLLLFVFFVVSVLIFAVFVF